ncbi:MAG: hypothetical protein ACO38W_00450 [Phycisphaerales bacterium]
MSEPPDDRSDPDSQASDSLADGTAAGSQEALREPLFRPLRFAMQLVGFAGGAALIVWCAWIAFTKADWSVLETADRGLVMLIAACSLVSMLCNGAIFWLAGRPLAPVSMLEMQGINACASVLNYAPVRLGAIVRIAYGLRISRMTVGAMAAWFTFIGAGVAGIAFLGAASAWLVPGGLLPTILAWIAAISIAMAMLRWMAHRVSWSRVRSLRATIDDPASLWGASALRMIDQVAWTGRMWAAASLIGLSLGPTQAILLATVAILVSLNPLGRFGYREAAVAWLASTLATGELDPTGIEAAFFQLAIIESVGEAIVLIPLGSIASVWCLRRLLGSRTGTTRRTADCR